MTEELVHTIALLETPGIGTMRARKLIEYFGSATEVMALKKKDLIEVVGIGNQIADALISKAGVQKAMKELEYIQKHHIQIITEENDVYPENLRQCFDRPFLLYVFGNLGNLTEKSIGIVGTRKATPLGIDNCRKLIHGIKEAGVSGTIISGLAVGIDAAAHTAALETEMPTVAVLAHGLDMIYPKNHAPMARRIVDSGGALVTEYIPHSTMVPENFVDRNRIIAGISMATVVIESGAKGGSLVTAEFANNYNRDVFAFPGRVNDKYSQGCNALIKANKAALIENHEDLIQAMNWGSKPKTINTQLSLFQELSADEQQIAKLLESEDKFIDILAIETGMSMQKLSATLLEMEFKGLVKTLPGKRYALTSV